MSVCYPLPLKLLPVWAVNGFSDPPWSLTGMPAVISTVIRVCVCVCVTNRCAALTSGRGPSLWRFSHMAGSCWLQALVSKVTQHQKKKKVCPTWRRGTCCEARSQPFYVYRLGLGGRLSHNQERLASCSSSCTAITSTFLVSSKSGALSTISSWIVTLLWVGL